MMRYLLMAAVLPWLCCACAGAEEAEEILKQEISRIQAEAREAVNDNGNYWLERTRYELMGDESKKKFRPLLRCLDSIKQTSLLAISELELMREDIALQANSKKELLEKLSSVQGNIDERKQQLRFHYTSFLQEQGEVFNIREKTKNTMQQYLDKVVAPLSSPVLWEAFLLLNKIDQQLALQSMILDWENSTTSLINHLGAGFFSCNRYVFEHTVLVSPLQNIVRKGESFNARIWLVHADDEYDHRQKKLFIDNTEFMLLAGDYADYVSEPIFENEKIINIKAFVQDPLTGKMELAFPAFEYEIKTE